MPKLGVNIDHIATVRQARREGHPDPLKGVKIIEQAGAHAIVAHLREDRRHINDRDVRLLNRQVKTKFNLEMSIQKDIVAIACRLRPDQATLVPEKRQELTTEGGLDVCKQIRRIKNIVGRLQGKGILVSLFIDPSERQIQCAKETGCDAIELHTGNYAQARTRKAVSKQLAKLKKAVQTAQEMGLIVHAGHGLNYQNTRAVARIAGIEELNIGHSIISRSIFAGLKKAVKEMLTLAKG